MTMTDELAEQRIRERTHTFQNVRPLHPQINAVCQRCGLMLPRGPILALGDAALPPCGDPPPVQDT